MKNIRSLIGVIAVSATLLLGCTTTQQTTAFKTIGATETAVLNANSAFLTSVVLGQTPTNSVPTVEAAFNDTQMALHAAAVLASGGTNAPVSAALDAKAQAFIGLTQKR